MPSLSELFSSQRKIHAVRRATEARVEFADADGVCATLEGEVAYRRGDALITGAAGERHPVRAGQFPKLYVAKSPTRDGESGVYTHLPTQVEAVQLDAPRQIPLGAAQGIVTANAGDWLVRHGEGDYGVVRADIFARTYVIGAGSGDDGAPRSVAAVAADAVDDDPAADTPAGRRSKVGDLWYYPLSFLYQGYVRAIRFVGWARKKQPAERKDDDSPGSAEDDERARLLGNAYRGAGVLIGFLAIAVVGLSVAAELLPQARSMNRTAAIAAPALILVLALLFTVRKGKEQWITTRMRAERYRFRKLSALLQSTDAGDEHALEAEIRFILGVPGIAATAVPQASGRGSQIDYHRERRDEYEAILRAAKRVNRVSLVTAVVLAAISWLTSWPLLVAVAVGLPSIAGALQGINGFLRLQERASEHADMAARLEKLRKEFTTAADAAARKQVAIQVHSALLTDNFDWQKTTRQAHDLA